MKLTIKDFIEEISRPFPRGHDEGKCKWLAHQLYVKVLRSGYENANIQLKPALIVITNRSY